MKKMIGFTMVLSLLLIAGCGYRFAPEGEHIDRRIQKVYVENVGNMTGEANLENYLRNAFIDQFREGSRFTLVYKKELSDAYLTARLLRVGTSHVSYQSDDVASENRVTLVIEAVFKERNGNGIIWTQKSLSGREAYRVDHDPNITANNRKDALKKLCDDLAEKAYRELMSGF